MIYAFEEISNISNFKTENNLPGLKFADVENFYNSFGSKFRELQDTYSLETIIKNFVTQKFTHEVLLQLKNIAKEFKEQYSFANKNFSTQFFYDQFIEILEKYKDIDDNNFTKDIIDEIKKKFDNLKIYSVFYPFYVLRNIPFFNHKNDLYFTVEEVFNVKNDNDLNNIKNKVFNKIKEEDFFINNFLQIIKKTQIFNQAFEKINNKFVNDKFLDFPKDSDESKINFWFENSNNLIFSGFSKNFFDFINYVKQTYKDSNNIVLNDDVKQYFLNLSADDFFNFKRFSDKENAINFFLEKFLFIEECYYFFQNIEKIFKKEIFYDNEKKFFSSEIEENFLNFKKAIIDHAAFFWIYFFEFKDTKTNEITDQNEDNKLNKFNNEIILFTNLLNIFLNKDKLKLIFENFTYTFLKKLHIVPLHLKNKSSDFFVDQNLADDFLAENDEIKKWIISDEFFKKFKLSFVNYEAMLLHLNEIKIIKKNNKFDLGKTAKAFLENKYNNFKKKIIDTKNGKKEFFEPNYFIEEADKTNFYFAFDKYEKMTFERFTDHLFNNISIISSFNNNNIIKNINVAETENFFNNLFLFFSLKNFGNFKESLKNEVNNFSFLTLIFDKKKSIFDQSIKTEYEKLKNIFQNAELEARQILGNKDLKQKIKAIKEHSNKFSQKFFDSYKKNIESLFLDKQLLENTFLKFQQKILMDNNNVKFLDANNNLVDFLTKETINKISQLSFDKNQEIKDIFNNLKQFDYLDYYNDFEKLIFLIDEEFKEKLKSKANFYYDQLAKFDLGYDKNNSKKSFNYDIWNKELDFSYKDIFDYIEKIYNQIKTEKDIFLNRIALNELFDFLTSSKFKDSQIWLAGLHYVFIENELKKSLYKFQYKENNSKFLIEYWINKGKGNDILNFVLEINKTKKYLYKEIFIEYLELIKKKPISYYDIERYFANIFTFQNKLHSIYLDYIKDFYLDKKNTEYYGYQNFTYLKNYFNFNIDLNDIKKYDLDVIFKELTIDKEKSDLDKFITPSFINEFNKTQHKLRNIHVDLVEKYYQYQKNSYIGASFHHNNLILKNLDVKDYLDEKKILLDLNSLRDKKGSDNFFEKIDNFNFNREYYLEFLKQQEKLFYDSLKLLKSSIQNFKDPFFYQKNGYFIENYLPLISKLSVKNKNSGHLFFHFYQKIKNCLDEQKKILTYINDYNKNNPIMAYQNKIIESLTKYEKNEEKEINIFYNDRQLEHFHNIEILFDDNLNQKKALQSFFSIFGIKAYATVDSNNKKQMLFFIPFLDRFIISEDTNFNFDKNIGEFISINGKKYVFSFEDYVLNPIKIKIDNNQEIDITDYVQTPNLKTLKLEIFDKNNYQEIAYLIKNLSSYKKITDEKITIGSFGVIENLSIKDEIWNYSTFDLFNKNVNLFLSSPNKLSKYLQKVNDKKLTLSDRTKIFIYDWKKFFDTNNIKSYSVEKTFDYLIRNGVDIFEINYEDKKKIPNYLIIIFLIVILFPITMFTLYKINQKVKSKLLIKKIKDKIK